MGGREWKWSQEGCKSMMERRKEGRCGRIMGKRINESDTQKKEEKDRAGVRMCKERKKGSSF